MEANAKPEQVPAPRQRQVSSVLITHRPTSAAEQAAAWRRLVAILVEAAREVGP